ncbi:MAG: hypothetical protein HOW73_32930 [Polyangiaceae bacterium]|nr:hypothetical protein [Polyangiaceae bacterium]
MADLESLLHSIAHVLDDLADALRDAESALASIPAPGDSTPSCTEPSRAA